MARTYKRDSRGRFAGGSGGSSRGGGRKPLQRGTNRLTRDNAGRITSVGGDGATARGGRLRTASGRQRATVTARGIGRAPAGTVGRSGRVKAPAKPAATAAQSKRRRLPASARPASTTPKPRGLEQMAVTNRIMNREQAAARSATARIERAQMRNRRLNTMQREIDYRRANPVGGRAARGQATKRLNKAQRKLDQSRGKIFSAIEVNYKPSRKRAEDRLAQLTRAVRSTAGLRAGRRGARYQRSLFGGATVAYNR